VGLAVMMLLGWLLEPQGQPAIDNIGPSVDEAANTVGEGPLC